MRLSAGDARRALTALEAAADDVARRRRPRDVATQSSGRSTRRPCATTATGDQHYDVISAFIKSIRGSDADAALHYLARMLVAGEDPRFVARRLMVHASEDIGLADPTALQAAVAAAQIVAAGRPARGADRAGAGHDAPGDGAEVERGRHRDRRRAGGRARRRPGWCRRTCATGTTPARPKLGNAVGYRYPHDVPDGVVAQQYPPDELVGRDYYRPTEHGNEREIAKRLNRLRAIIRKRR